MKLIKSVLIFIFIISIANNGFGQSWVTMMSDTNANFYDIQKSFNTYWEGKKIEKGKGYKQFKRWEQFMAPRVYPSGNVNFQANLWNEYQILKNNSSQKNITETANWQELGPFTIPGNGGAGRINCVAFHPSNANIMYVGAPAGGLWKTTNGGTTWTTSTDILPNLGVSTIAIDSKNPDIIYMGTGDADAGDTYSIGVLKSIDGGTTWNTSGLSFTLSQNKRVTKLLIHPSNTDTIYAATNAGIYRSTDAGSTFSLIRSGNFKDLEFKPDDPNYIWACTSNRIWKSTNAGNTWTSLSTFAPLNVTRTTIAVTANDPNYLYILTGSDLDNGLEGVYRTTDLGATVTQCASTYPNLLGWAEDGSDSGGQAWYDLALAVSPTNKNTVLVGGVNIWKSTDGGFNWDLNAHWYGGGGAPYVHADIHTIEFYPGSGSTVFTGCDGGLFKSTNTGSTWDDKSDWLSIGQMYRLGCSASDPDLVITGWQDNGSNLYNAPSWNNVLGGDGMECMIDYSNNNYMYGSIYYGDLYRSSDGGNNWTPIKNNITEDGAWITPFVQDPQAPQTIYAGYGNIWKSTNRGNSWTQISNLSGGNKISSIAVSPVSSNTIYFCTDYYVYVTFNGGSTWTQITYGSGTGTGLPSLVFTDIIVSPTDQNVAWISMSGFSAGLKVYMTRDGGLTWTNYSGSLPNIPANCLVYENATDEGIYVGTDLGVFYRDSTMADWVAFNTGLPNVIVDELEIYYGTGKLRAATYGRGLWETDLYSVVSVKDDNLSKTEFEIFPNPGNGIVNIKINADTYQSIDKIEIFNEQGKLVISKSFTGNTYEAKMDISNESAGLYLVRVSTPKSTISGTFLKN